MWEGKRQSCAWEYEEHRGRRGERRCGFLEEADLSAGGGPRVSPPAGGFSGLVLSLSKDIEERDCFRSGKLEAQSTERVGRSKAGQVGLACKPLKGVSTHPMDDREPWKSFKLKNYEVRGPSSSLNKLKPPRLEREGEYSW